MIKIKKIKINKKYLEISFYILFTSLIIILFNNILNNFSEININLNKFISLLKAVLAPVIYGILIAYFLNIPMISIETRIASKIPYINQSERKVRALSIFLTYILVFGFIFLIIAYLIPELIKSFQGFISSIIDFQGSSYLSSSDNVIKDLLDSIDESYNIGFTYEDAVSILLNYVRNIVDMLPTLSSSLLSGTIGFATIIYRFVVGIIISVYLLTDKETFAKLFTKILYSFTKYDTASKIISAATLSNNTVQKFTIGQLTDAVVFASLFFVMATILNFPYPLLLSMILGVVNVVPFFGSIVGSILVLIIIFLVQPQRILFASLAVLIIQQIDGNIIGPKILGNALNLKPIAIILSVLIGGAIGGVWGMFFGAPLFAVLKQFFNIFLDNNYEKQLKKYKESHE